MSTRGPGLTVHHGSSLILDDLVGRLMREPEDRYWGALWVDRGRVVSGIQSGVRAGTIGGGSVELFSLTWGNQGS